MPSPIDDKYQQLGGADGSDLGNPVSPEEDAADGGRRRVYQYGAIYWSPWTGAHEVHGEIWQTWLNLGGAEYGSPRNGPLGYPRSDELELPDGTGRYSHFELGSIYYVGRGDDGFSTETYRIDRKFADTRRNDDGTMHGHLKIYNELVAFYGWVTRGPHVGYPSDAEFTYSTFICAPWWRAKRCARPGSTDCSDDPPDGDLDFSIRVNREVLETDPYYPTSFWNDPWWFGDDYANKIRAKLDYGGSNIGVECIMFGRSGRCGTLNSPNLPLLPGWAEKDPDSILVNGRPVNGQITFGIDNGKDSAEVDTIGGERLEPGTLVRIVGTLVLDCGHDIGDCADDDAETQNVEIHPLYSIDVLGIDPNWAARSRLFQLQDELRGLEHQAAADVHGASVVQVQQWRQKNDELVGSLVNQLSGKHCRIDWEKFVGIGTSPKAGRRTRSLKHRPREER
jgi:hypothetical protein